MITASLSSTATGPVGKWWRTSSVSTGLGASGSAAALEVEDEGGKDCGDVRRRRRRDIECPRFGEGTGDGIGAADIGDVGVLAGLNDLVEQALNFLRDVGHVAHEQLSQLRSPADLMKATTSPSRT